MQNQSKASGTAHDIRRKMRYALKSPGVFEILVFIKNAIQLYMTSRLCFKSLCESIIMRYVPNLKFVNQT